MTKWFNLDMSAQFCDVESAKLKAGKTWGLCCTDLFGMVSQCIIAEGWMMLNMVEGDGLA
jgi:hypothetical protein